MHPPRTTPTLASLLSPAQVSSTSIESKSLSYLIRGNECEGFWIGVMLAIATLSLVFLLAQHVQCVAVVQNEDQSLYPALTLWIMQPQL